MRNIIAVCTLLILVLACQAGAVTSYIETFNGSYVSGSIGPMPAGWTQFGYGPPAAMVQETGLVLSPNDGSNSAYRVNCPGSAVYVNPVGQIIIYKTGVKLDSYALPGQPIDWNYPVYLKADVHGADYSIGKKWQTLLDLQSYTRTTGKIEWGDNGADNGTWQTLTTVISPGQAGKTGTMLIETDLDFTGSNAFTQTNAAIWENIRIEYTAVPEPSSFAALAAGLLGLGGFIRKRK